MVVYVRRHSRQANHDPGDAAAAAAIKTPALYRKKSGRHGRLGVLGRDGAYMRSGALMPINSKERRNTIWADSTSFNRAAVMALSSSLEETTRQFS